MRTPLSVCPTCGAKLDKISHKKNDPPRPDDLTICVYCHTILRFNENLQQVKLSKQELEELKTTEAWKEIQKMAHDKT